MTLAQFVDVYTAALAHFMPYAVAVDAGIAILAVLGIAWKCGRVK